MIDFVLDYMGQKGQYADTQKEQKAIEQGISLYLTECGVPEDASGEYYRKFIKEHLGIISNEDLKKYFICYPTISKVNQIAIEQKVDGTIPDARRSELYQLMKQLYEHGIGEKYIPIQEVKEALGKFS